MKEIAIVVAAHDGLVSLITGVGVVVNSFIESFEEIKMRSSILRNNKTELLCLAPYLPKSSRDYNLKIEEKTKHICISNNGRLVEIPTFANGDDDIWDGLNQWRSASLSVASYVTATYDKYGLIILFAHDTIFSSVRKYTPNLHKLKIIWIPHSLGMVFRDEFSDPKRLSIEKESIESIQRTKQDIIGYISNSFRDVLHKEYGVHNKKLVPFINSIYRKSSRFNISDSIMADEIKNSRIALDKNIIFSWGRCVYQKGYDLLIQAYRKFLIRNSNYHLVLLMPTSTSPNEYVNKIKKQISMLPDKSITAIYDFKETLPYSILHHPNLRLVIFPSRFEGAPLTILEALSFAKNDVNFVYSAIPPLLQIFKEDSRGIPIQDLTAESLCNGMEKASKKRNITIKKGIVTDFVDSYVKGLNISMGGYNC